MDSDKITNRMLRRIVQHGEQADARLARLEAVAAAAEAFVEAAGDEATPWWDDVTEPETACRYCWRVFPRFPRAPHDPTCPAARLDAALAALRDGGGAA